MIEFIKWALDQDVKPSARKFVLVVLANYADESGVCYPSQATIARRTGQSERSVRGHLAALEAAGLIERVPCRGGDGTFAPDTFRLCAAPQDLQPEPSRPSRRRARKPAPAAKSAAGPTANSAAGPAASFDATSGNFCGDSIEESASRTVSRDSHTQSRARAEDRFAEFWSAYPRRDDDPQERAREAWARALADGADPDELIAAAQRYARALERRPNSWAQYAATWLRERRWRDFPAERPRVPASAPAEVVPLDPASVSDDVPRAEAARWHATRPRLAAAIGEAAFRMWLAPLSLVAADERAWTFGAPSTFHADYVRQHFTDALERALARAVEVTTDDRRRRENDSDPSAARS